MNTLVTTVFWLSCLAMLYVYGGYYLCLCGLARFVRTRQRRRHETLPGVSVIVAAHNEEKRVERRIRNLLSLRYPAEQLQIIIASDGSTDGTVDRSRQFGSVCVLDFAEKRGRAAIQNDAVDVATGELVFFTDAETVFQPDFLEAAVEAFSDPTVGCAVGNLVYQTQGAAIAEAEGFYLRLEKMTRAKESRLGILATATGACMGVRRSLWRKLQGIDDCDFAAPLDVILQGCRVTYVPGAIAYDVPASNLMAEFRTRSRQTSKNLLGTLRRWGWTGWVRHPVVGWGLMSHKILRWMTPFFLLAAMLSNMVLFSTSIFYRAALAVQFGCYILALLGLLAYLASHRVPVASTAFSFCAANVGMGVGVFKGLLGMAPVKYTGDIPATHNCVEEAARIQAAYANRDDHGKRELYRRSLPGVTYNEYRKQVTWARALQNCSPAHLQSLDMLDVGCGDGAWLRTVVEWGADPGRLHGIDLLEDRIATARSRSLPEIDFRCASAWPLPFEDDSMDLVTASTVFSSILDPQARRALAQEMVRVTKPGGHVMIYDFIVSHPRNPDTIGMGAAQVKRLFADLLPVRTYRLTLLPQLTRLLAPYVPWLAHTLEYNVPFLCTHRLSVLRKPPA